jgi:ribulose-5-phosphate 4-epimerase/fuculose-1-phosphate aldolase
MALPRSLLTAALVAGLIGGLGCGVARAAEGPLPALIDDLVAANHILYYHGIVDGYGHVSFRSPTDPAHFYMAAAVSPGRVVAADVVELDLDGRLVGDQKRPTYSERFIHAEIYRARRDVNAVVHSHSPTVIPFGITGVALRPVMHSAAFLYTGVPVFDTRGVAAATSLLVNNPEVAKALAARLGSNAVVLMRGHGDAVVAGDIREAVSRAIYTEVDARLQLQAISLGRKIEYLSPQEGRAMAAPELPRAAGSSHGVDRVWQMWLDEAAGKAITAGH